MTRWNNFVLSLQRIEWTDVAVAIGIFFIFLVFRKIFTKYIFKLILSVLKRTPTDMFANIFESFERPLRVFWVVIGTYLALVYLPFHFTTIAFVEHLYKTIIIILFGWGFYNYSSHDSSIFGRLVQKLDRDEDSMLIPFLSKILRFLVVAFTIAIVLSEWGFDINGFVAGLGLGGLAFALAAQETVKNFLGGIVIITEKPFSKGDWIYTPTVEGTVEDITFRSTQIRTFADSVIVVPNSTLSNEPITNWSKMTKRRVTFSLGIDILTPKDKVERCVRKIEYLLTHHVEVHQETILVRFDTFNSTSLDIFIYYFTNTTVWADYLRIKEEINLEMMNILAEENVSIATPIRTIQVNEETADFYRDVSERNVEKLKG